jgi:hypothetical protein
MNAEWKPNMNFTTDEAALAGYRWAKGDEEEKAQLFKNQGRFREIYVRLPDDKFFLFTKLQPELWPELIKLDYRILNRSVQSTPILLNALASLSAADGVRAFHYIQQYRARRSVVKGLNAESKIRVLKGLTQASIARMQQLQARPSNGHFFIATKSFLATLPESAQACCYKSCAVDRKTGFKKLVVFTISRCLRHSFHKQCAKLAQCCTDLPKRLPKEVLDNIARHTSGFTAGLLAHEFGIFAANQLYQRIWYEIFKDGSWLDFVVQQDAHPGLLGSGMDSASINTSKYLILLLHKDRKVLPEESKRLFFQSVRTYSVSDEYQHEIIIGGIRLNIREIYGKSILVTESPEPERYRYCFYTDMQRSLRSIGSANTISQDGEVFCLKLSFAAQQKQWNYVHEGVEDVPYRLEQREQIYQVFIGLKSLSSCYHVRLGDRLSAPEDTLYGREVIGFEWASGGNATELFNFVSLHPADFALVS